MLHINDLTYRLGARLLIDHATLAIPDGAKVGLVGRNGAGKSTLFKLITGELALESGSVGLPRNARIGGVAQEAPSGPTPLIEIVLAADAERARLLAEADQATDPHRIAEIHTRLVDIDAHSAEARAATILAGLGFDDAAQQRPASDFSGGWRMRVALAAVLFAAPDLLLLDEPTNYLDLEGTMWLETYLGRYPHTVLLISHDRDLLNRAVGMIAHLDEGKLTLYRGGYDAFDRKRREQQALQTKLKKKQDEQRKHMEAFVERFRYKASKARQAQSRMKALEKLQPIAAVAEESVYPFIIPSPERPAAPPLIRVSQASAGYEPGKPVLSGIDLRIDTDDRIALLGANGNGKSTFAKLLSGRLEPMSGEVARYNKISIAYFAQHQLDELVPEQSAYQHVKKLMPDAPEPRARARAGALGFPGAKMDTPVKNLSGGEKARLLLGLATFNGPDLLVLDEPTNHLDIDSREALVAALNEYEGAVLIISHDRHMIEASADRLLLVANGRVTDYEGDIDDYRRLVLKGPGNGKSPAEAPPPPREPQNSAERRRTSAEDRAKLAPLRKSIATSEARMEKLRREIERLDGILADPGLYDRDAPAAARHGKARSDAEKALVEEEQKWLEANEELEQANGS